MKYFILIFSILVGSFYQFAFAKADEQVTPLVDQSDGVSFVSSENAPSGLPSKEVAEAVRRLSGHVKFLIERDGQDKVRKAIDSGSVRLSFEELGIIVLANKDAMTATYDAKATLIGEIIAYRIIERIMVNGVATEYAYLFLDTTTLSQTSLLWKWMARQALKEKRDVSVWDIMFSESPDKQIESPDVYEKIVRKEMTTLEWLSLEWYASWKKTAKSDMLFSAICGIAMGGITLCAEAGKNALMNHLNNEGILDATPELISSRAFKTSMFAFGFTLAMAPINAAFINFRSLPKERYKQLLRSTIPSFIFSSAIVLLLNPEVITNLGSGEVDAFLNFTSKVGGIVYNVLSSRYQQEGWAEIINIQEDLSQLEGPQKKIILANLGKAKWEVSVKQFKDQGVRMLLYPLRIGDLFLTALAPQPVAWVAKLGFLSVGFAGKLYSYFSVSAWRKSLMTQIEGMKDQGKETTFEYRKLVSDAVKIQPHYDRLSKETLMYWGEVPEDRNWLQRAYYGFRNGCASAVKSVIH